QHLDDLGGNLQDGHVERAAAQVVHHYLLAALLVQPVGQRGGGGLVDDAQHVQPRNLPRVLGGLPLRVGKVGGNGDDRVGHRRADVAFRVGLELLQNHGGYLLRSILPVVNFDAVGAAHLPLDGGDGP